MSAPNGDLTDETIRPVEAIDEISPTLGVRIFTVMCALEPGDLEVLAAGGTVLISFYGAMVPFEVNVCEPVAETRSAVNGDLWVRSDVLPDGTYGVAINVGDDRAWILNRDQAVAYAISRITRATEAEHDAAVFAAFKVTGMDDLTAGTFIVKDIRPDRPDDDSATKPLRFIAALGLKVGPYIKMEIDGKPCGEMTTADLIDHAMGVLKTLAAADLDAALLRVLAGSVGLDEATARAVVGSLGGHWPRSEVRHA